MNFNKNCGEKKERGKIGHTGSLIGLTKCASKSTKENNRNVKCACKFTKEIKKKWSLVRVHSDLFYAFFFSLLKT